MPGPAPGLIVGNPQLVRVGAELEPLQPWLRASVQIPHARALELGAGCPCAWALCRPHIDLADCLVATPLSSRIAIPTAEFAHAQVHVAAAIGVCSCSWLPGAEIRVWRDSRTTAIR